MQIVCQVHEQPRTRQLSQIDGKLFIYIKFQPVVKSRHAQY